MCRFLFHSSNRRSECSRKNEAKQWQKKSASYKRQASSGKYTPDWLANMVMVKKANRKWRMCIDFIDLNKARPKDSYPFPRVNVLVDSTAQHQLLSFMEAFSGYNQIRMDEVD